VILTMLDNVNQGELQRYENNYKALNVITTAVDRNVYDRVSHLKLLTIFGLNCATLMRPLLRLSLLVKILTIGSTKPFLRNLGNSIVSNFRSCGPLAYSDSE
jgi:hypothetical protein